MSGRRKAKGNSRRPARAKGRTSRPTSRKVSTRGAKPRRSRRRGPALLVIECDIDKLAQDGFTIGRDVLTVVAKLCPGIAVRSVRARTSDELLHDLGQVASESFLATVVMVACHSNHAGLKLASDLFVPWRSFASWLAPFEPRHVAVFGCEGGRWLPSQALFEGIRSLQAVYGSPVPHTQNEMSVLKLLVPFLLSGGKLSADAHLLAQAVNFAATGGLIARATRKDVAGSDPWKAVLWTGLEELARAFLRR